MGTTGNGTDTYSSNGNSNSKGYNNDFYKKIQKNYIRVEQSKDGDGRNYELPSDEEWISSQIENKKLYEGLRASITETVRTNQDKMDSANILSKIRGMIEHNSDRDSEHLQMILAIVGFYKNYIGDTKSRLDQALREKKFFELCLEDEKSQILTLKNKNSALLTQMQDLSQQHESYK